jgi:hypothetical protein
MKGMAGANRQFLRQDLPEVFHTTEHAAASRATRRGDLRRLARGLYTTNLDEPAEQLVRRRWLDVAAIYFPGAVIVDRSAIDGRPAEDGSLFLDAGPGRRAGATKRLPGLVLRARPGPGVVEGDMPFGDLHRSGQARTALDNMRPSRARAGVARTLSRSELEEWLETLARNRGEEELLRIRDEARRLGPLLDAEPEQDRLDRLIGALLGTRQSSLSTRVARARSSGVPYDARRAALFERLHGALAGHLAPVRPEPPDPKRVFAFFEAYFSNFIEGTEFLLDEAEDIVFHGAIPADRPEDAHDVLGTFRTVTDPATRARVPTDADDFIALLAELNRRILKQRPTVNPGELKREPNRAGGTTFVAPDLVEGTLRDAWRLYETLPAGFARAVFAMFAVTEVHPFADGNGRVARALANAELSAAGECRVLVPLSYRGDYLSALRAMSRQGNQRPLLRMAERAQRWASLVDWSDMSRAIAQLEATNALVPADEAEEEGTILLDPGSSTRR